MDYGNMGGGDGSGYDKDTMSDEKAKKILIVIVSIQKIIICLYM